MGKVEVEGLINLHWEWRPAKTVSSSSNNDTSSSSSKGKPRQSPINIMIRLVGGQFGIWTMQMIVLTLFPHNCFGGGKEPTLLRREDTALLKTLFAWCIAHRASPALLVEKAVLSWVSFFLSFFQHEPHQVTACNFIQTHNGSQDTQTLKI